MDLEHDRVRADGKTVVERKGSIQLLKEWLKKKVRLEEPDAIDKITKTLKKIRKLRQKPAHAVDEDKFDNAIFKEQRALIGEAYGAVRLIRLILANHPATKSHKVPDWLFEAKIYNY